MASRSIVAAAICILSIGLPAQAAPVGTTKDSSVEAGNIQLAHYRYYRHHHHHYRYYREPGVYFYYGPRRHWRHHHHWY